MRFKAELKDANGATFFIARNCENLQEFKNKIAEKFQQDKSVISIHNSDQQDKPWWWDMVD